jgi:hypothetical protein
VPNETKTILRLQLQRPIYVFLEQFTEIRSEETRLFWMVAVIKRHIQHLYYYNICFWHACLAKSTSSHQAKIDIARKGKSFGFHAILFSLHFLAPEQEKGSG